VPIIIPISYDLAQEHGVNAAIVHQQVTHWAAQDGAMALPGREAGWFTGSAEQLAKLCPITVKQIRTAMATLLAAGLMEKAKFRSSTGDQTCSYRPVEYRKPSDQPFALQGKSGSAPQGKSTFALQGNCTSLLEEEIFTTRASGDAQVVVEMFPATDSPPPAPSKRKPKAARRDYDTGFLAWWAKYPNKLNKADAWELWKLVDHQAVDTALGHYLTSIATHEAQYPGAKVSPLYATTFLNGRWENWEHGPCPNPYWPKTGDTGEDVAEACALAKKLWDAAENLPGRRADSWKELLADHPRILAAVRNCGNNFVRARTDADRLTVFQAAWAATGSQEAAS
jgi:hypothetical protein